MFVDEEEISIASNTHLLKNEVHFFIQEVLNEVRLPYKLSDLQLLSIHVIVSPTGSGKTNVIYL